MVVLQSFDRPGDTFFWTAPAAESSELATEDPLALDYVAQQVGLLLLPTFTTRSTRAQAFAMVAYGLSLVERAIRSYGYPNTDETRRGLFERWERFWALATLEHRGGQLPRGDWDTMRGVRGARAAWRAGDKPLPIDFPLISRQQELGNLGAYLAPLRRAGLVLDGTLRPSPAALDLIDAFWDEPEENRTRGRYDDYALSVLNRETARLVRSHGNLTLGRVGERSRLTSLVARRRTTQQGRLFEALFERAKDPHTRATAGLVQAAVQAGVVAPRAMIEGAVAGRFGVIGTQLHDLLVTAMRLGDAIVALVGAFDRVYDSLDRAGWITTRARSVAEAFRPSDLAALRGACTNLLDAPCVSDLRRLPMHGGSFVRLAEGLSGANADVALGLLLAYHAGVQRDRRRGEGWIREEGDRLVLVVTSYTARPDSPRFPSFKLDAVRTLLVDVGRLPLAGAEEAPGVDA